ncbi:hypothetical protein EJ05DRAFT_65369 [Pseudovirgaria hyperparasitica]|uniref:Class II aldolase/adducin N-terminal domain-containing protein n=1 Tax=Pseudovirgaria hyperparasitica TaxID=470096 RepID=A0A6A6W3A4_9PEZI|nr:uncharacterized protein EJ05DRAFT_65369 [Pseudovirgaria hyperparasitica]KAF2756456.1 hypothetical protein EJ05DRAFT_65369 [Pseudovirgaria hyperparasitica]
MKLDEATSYLARHICSMFYRHIVSAKARHSACCSTKSRCRLSCFQVHPSKSISMSAGFFPKSESLEVNELWKGLITASHILHYHRVLDAYGHISVRNPDNANTFYMTRKVAPALASRGEDIVEYKVEDATPVQSNAPDGFIERYIHSEIYKRFPSMNCVIHSHCREILPYCINDIPLQAVIHQAGFIGSRAPVWDISSTYSTFSSSDPYDLLVRNTSIGSSLAAEFKPSTSAGFIFSQMKSALPNIAGKSSNNTSVPSYAVVLMRGHGFTTCAEGIEAAVYQAIYTKENAIVQTTALNMKNAVSGSTIEGKVDVEGSGKIKDGKLKSDKGLRGLSDKEIADTVKMNQESMMRPWELWCREVEVQPLYINEC